MANDSSVWPKLSVVASAFSLVVLPLVIAYITNSATRDLKNREIEAHFVELAISILNTAPRADNSDAPLREWAANVVDHYSGVTLSTKAVEVLRTSPIPSSPVVSAAAELERQGFEALLGGDVAVARAKFNETNRVYPGYHSVWELSRELKEQPDKLTDPEARKRVLSTVKDKYLWAVPADIQTRIKDESR